MDLARLMQELFDKEVRISFAPERKGEIRRNYSDISRARKVLGFEPGVDLETGLDETILYFVEKVGSKE